MAEFGRISKFVLCLFIFSLLFTPFCRTTPQEEAEWGIDLKLLSSITLQAWAYGSEANICIQGTRLFTGLGAGGMEIYDINTPESPQLLLGLRVNFFPQKGQPGAIAAQGNIIFVAIPMHNLICLMDISDPTNPQIVESFGNIPDIQQLAIRAGYLFIYCGSSFAHEGGVYVYDISVASPVLAGTYLTNLVDPGFCVNPTGVVFFARRPASLNDSPKVEVVDLSDPANPVLLERWESDYFGNITDIYLKEDKLYCSAYWGGIWVLDATDFNNLILISRFDWNDMVPYALSVRADPPFSFLAQSGNTEAYYKFLVFRHQDETISLEKEVPSTKSPQWIYIKDDLLFLIEKESGWPSLSSLESLNIREQNSVGSKIINIYRIKKSFQ